MFYQYKMAAKAIGIYTKTNYVTVTLCICSEVSVTQSGEFVESFMCIAWMRPIAADVVAWPSVL